MDGVSMHIPDLPDFRLFLQDYFAEIYTQGLPEKAEFDLNTIYEIGSEILNGKNEAAQRLLNRIQDEHHLEQCLLWYGATKSLRFVRFIVEELKRSKSELLLEFHPKWGKNALHLAVEDDQRDVVEYLLAEWSQTQVPIISTKAGSSRVLSDSRLHFDSAKYFEELGKVAPAHISKVKSHDKTVWYFLTRMMDRWVKEENGKKIWDEQGEKTWDEEGQKTRDEEGGWYEVGEQIWDKEREKCWDEGEKPGRKISPHILEALQKVYTDNAFQSACLRVQDVKYLAPLWEIYGHDPTLFMRMADWAASVNANYFFSQQFLELQRQNCNPKFKEMLDVWKDSYHQKFASTAAFLEILQRDWNCMQECWSAYDFRDDLCSYWISYWGYRGHGEGITPLLQGLYLVFDKLISYTVQKEAGAAVEMMIGSSIQAEVSHKSLESWNEEIGVDRAKPFTCYYLLAAAGSGKTHHLMDVLSNNLGFYLSSGAIKDAELKSGEALYSARTMGASKDTQHLFRTTRSPWLHSKGVWTASEWLSVRCDSLVMSRKDLFYHVVDLYKEKKVRLTPQDWLRYQLSCRHERDSFAMIFVFSMMRGINKRHPRLYTDVANLIWCFDEVQGDLAEMADNEGSTNLLACFIHALRRGYSNRAALSGTALNFDKVKAVVDNSDKNWKESSVSGVLPCFTLITEDSIFAEVFQTRTAELLDLLYGSSTPEELVRKTYSGNKVFIPANERDFNDSYLFRKFRAYCCTLPTGEPPPKEAIIKNLQEHTVRIVQTSLSFRGRYRWSVYYIEKLLEQYFIHGAMTEQVIEKVAEEAKEILKAPIKRRLHDLARRPRQTQILKDVYNMAFDADLFGRSRILSSEGGAELIEQALGYVETSEGAGVEAVKVSLAERLVVDSVMEYLEETKQLLPLATNYLYANQFHEDALGNAAEVGLAYGWSSQELPQRREFISVFESIYKVSGAGCRFNVNLNLDNFFLEKGKGLQRDYFQALPEGYRPVEGGDLGLKQWLYLVCNEESRPTFLFPEQAAGPDVMFVYRERGGRRQRIIFAIQLKTGSANLVDDNVMRTIDPDRWFSTKPNLQRDFQEVLKACKDKETISFLSVAFIASRKFGLKTKHEAAIKYMKTRVSISSTWSTDFQEALNQVNSPKNEYDNRNSDAARSRLEISKQKLREQEDAFETPKSAAQVSKPVVEVEKTSTDYYFQILADDAVEPVFGRVFARLLRGVKTNAVFTRKDRDYEELGALLHPPFSIPPDEEEEEGHDGSENDDESLGLNIFDN